MTVLRRILLLVALIFGVACLPPAEASVTRVTEVQVSLAGDATRVTLVAKGGLSAEIFTLDSPGRVVVDLPVVEWPEGATVPVPDGGVVAQLRFGQFDPKTSRLVLALKEPAKVAGTELRTVNGRTRLQIELRPTGAARMVVTRQSVEPPLGEGGAVSGATAEKRPEKPAGGAGTAAATDRAADRTTGEADATASSAQEKGGVQHVVAVDAGHGGVDPGATGASGTLEKNVTLAAARELKRVLEDTGRYRVVMTRNSDVYVPLADRVEIARGAGAELFISLHADKHDSPRVRGASVYTLSETASDAETEAYAKRENSADVVAGIDLGEDYDEEVARILISLVQQSTMNCSAVFASGLTKQIKKQTRMLPKPHRFAGFRVLKAPDVPSVLVELGYLSNAADEKGLRSKVIRARLMGAVSKAIDAYFARRTC